MTDTINKEKGSPWYCGALDKLAGAKPNPHKRDDKGVRIRLDKSSDRSDYLRGYLQSNGSAA